MTDQPELFEALPAPPYGDVAGILLTSEPPLSPDAARLLPILAGLHRRGHKVVAVIDIAAIAQIADEVLAVALAELVAARLSAKKDSGTSFALVTGPALNMPEPAWVELEDMTRTLATLEEDGLNIVRPFLLQGGEG